MEKYKILFLGSGLCEWGGGIDYLCQIVSAYSYLARHTDAVKIEMSAIIPFIDTSILDDKLRKEILISNLIKIESSIKIYYLSQNESLKEKIMQMQPDFVMPYCYGAFRNFSIPYISYIPDFQEEYYKQYFSPTVIVVRRQVNAFILSYAPYVIATSNSVALDIKKFYPQCRSHIFIQPFAPLSCCEYWNTSNVDLTKYELPDKYFIVSNQFWMHKDHITVFRAVKSLLESGYKDVFVVCTGKMEDYRNTNYNEELKQFISENSLEKNIKLLGYISKLEQIEIMKNAIALIQPTQFEGDPGGCSVYEAVSYGKAVIMSDILVNLEASGTEDVYYFKVGDSEDLASKMKLLFKKAYRPYKVEIAQRIFEKNVKIITKFYMDMMKCVVKR